jgi:hypothetical protein
MGCSGCTSWCRVDEDGVRYTNPSFKEIKLINRVWHFRFISRANPKDAQRHVIVGVQSYKPLDFARQMNVSLANGWGIVRTIADLVLKQPEGKYVLVKDPNNVSP